AITRFIICLSFSTIQSGSFLYILIFFAFFFFFLVLFSISFSSCHYSFYHLPFFLHHPKWFLPLHPYLFRLLFLFPCPFLYLVLFLPLLVLSSAFLSPPSKVVPSF